MDYSNVEQLGETVNCSSHSSQFRGGGLAAEPTLRKLMYNCYKGTHAF